MLSLLRVLHHMHYINLILGGLVLMRKYPFSSMSQYYNASISLRDKLFSQNQVIFGLKKIILCSQTLRTSVSLNSNGFPLIQLFFRFMRSLLKFLHHMHHISF